jgi:hypothetical protein
MKNKFIHPIDIYQYPEIIWKILSVKVKKTKDLLFVHTPKCGGSYVKHILWDLQIPTSGNGHVQAPKNAEQIVFTVFRNPIDRFESFLNYRLKEGSPRKDWPSNLSYVFQDKTIDLNYIVSQLTDEQILSFRPFKTLNFWYTNIDIVITIDQLHEFLSFFNKPYDSEKYSKKNVSPKNRGFFSELTKTRLKKTYSSDIELFNTLFPRSKILI